MNYITFTQQFHLADKTRQQELKKLYPHYYTNMMNRAWSMIEAIRARKRDKVVDIKAEI